MSLYSHPIKLFIDNSSFLILLAISEANKLLPPPVCLLHLDGEIRDGDDRDSRTEAKNANNFSILKEESKKIKLS